MFKPTTNIKKKLSSSMEKLDEFQTMENEGLQQNIDNKWYNE